MEPLYEQSGQVYGWIDRTTGRIVALHGQHVAFVEGDHVYNWNGQHIGWWQEQQVQLEATSICTSLNPIRPREFQ